MPAQNLDIIAIYNSLCDQQDALSDAIQKVTDPKVAAAISTEIQEISHRIILTQNLLFLADAPELSAAMKGVGTASSKLTTAIDDFQQPAQFINAVSAYLSCVDKALDLAKTLAAAA